MVSRLLALGDLWRLGRLRQPRISWRKGNRRPGCSPHLDDVHESGNRRQARRAVPGKRDGQPDAEGISARACEARNHAACCYAARRFPETCCIQSPNSNPRLPPRMQLRRAPSNLPPIKPPPINPQGSSSIFPQTSRKSGRLCLPSQRRRSRAANPSPRWTALGTDPRRRSPSADSDTI